jgi:LuxR family maltose regulon positive regulatory protein
MRLQPLVGWGARIPQSRRESRLSERLLATKYVPPPPRMGAVPRAELFAHLDMASAVTLLSAPPGYGKTTLVAGWLAGRAGPAAWLTLDEDDSDPTRFVAYLSAAIRHAAPDIEFADAAAGPGEFDSRAGLVPLLNALTAASEPLVIVLDDYHLLSGRQVHGLVAFLVGHLPAHVRLVLISRENPPLPLARLRARGQLTEIRANDLRFDAADARRFFADTLGLELSPAIVEELTVRTEGWPAGLQLAGLSLQAGFDPATFVSSFGATDRFVLDYLADEVLARLPEDTRRFLTQTAIVERLCAPLCDALTGRTDSVGMLAALERSNLLLIALDERREWYRYHALFADVLRAGLAPDERRELNARAATWLADHEFLAEAIRSALAAEQPDRAASLMEAAADATLARGEVATILHWCDLLPPDVLAARPTLRLIRAWALFFAGALPEADGACATIHPDLLGPAGAGRLFALRAWLGNRLDRPETVRLARRAVHLVPQSDGVFRSLALMTLGETIFAGDAAGALEAFDAAEAAYPAVGSALWCGLTYDMAQVEVILGRRAAAEERCRRAFDEPRAAPSFASGAIGFVHEGLGMALFEAGEFATAQEQLVLARDECQRAGLRRAMFGTLDSLEVLALHASGQRRQAWRRLEIFREEAGRVGADAILAGMPFLEAELARREGDLDRVARLAPELVVAGHVRAHGNDIGPQTQAAVQLALGRPGEAFSILEPLAARQRESGRRGRLVATLVLACAALDTLGRAADAERCMDEAVACAAPDQIRRPFLEERRISETWLPRLRDTSPGFVDDVLARFVRRASAQGRGQRGRRLLTAGDALLEPLSARELDVLRLVVAGLSNDEVARELYIGVGTTKWHVHNLLDKVGVRDRVNLARRARELDLLG